MFYLSLEKNENFVNVNIFYENICYFEKIKLTEFRVYQIVRLV